MVSFQKYKEFERAVRVEEIDGLRLVKRLAEDMEEMFLKKAQAMKVNDPHILDHLMNIFVQTVHWWIHPQR